MDLIVSFPNQDSPLRRRSFSRPERAVSFSLDEIEVNYVENLSFKYKRDIWYSGQEMKDFKRQNVRFLHCISSTNMSLAQFAIQTIESGKDSSIFMGLESYLSTQIFQNITERKKAVRRAVIQEQECQSERGIYDPERLSLIIRSSSEASARRARVIALLHASEEK